MPTRSIDLTEELDTFIAHKVESGRYEDASDVMRAALRSLEHEERLDQLKLEALRTAIAEGDASGIFEGDPFEAALRELNLPISRV